MRLVHSPSSPAPCPASPSYPSSQEEAGTVCCSVVGKAHCHTKLGQFMRVGGCEDHIPLDLGVHHLAGDVLVGEAHHQTILWSVVLVSVLSDEALTGIVVSLSLCRAQTAQRGRWRGNTVKHSTMSDSTDSTRSRVRTQDQPTRQGTTLHCLLTSSPPELDLVAHKIRSVLDNFHKRLHADRDKHHGILWCTAVVDASCCIHATATAIARTTLLVDNTRPFVCKDAGLTILALP